LPPCRAKWARVETTAVPVDRVLSNLTTRLAKNTNDFQLLHNLARLHSLSYARAASNWLVEVQTNQNGLASNSDLQPFFGSGDPGFPPSEVAPLASETSQVAAKKHLAAATEFYKRCTLVNPTNEIPWIGLGWCQLQAGQTNAAKQTLRAAVKLARAKEQTGSGWASPTAEAITYLRSVLDRKSDKKELDDLTRIAEQAHKVPRWVTPLVIPLQSNLTPSDLINTNASVSFDLDGSGIPNRQWQWINTNAAWIVHLRQGGPVTSALQMFGNVTFWMFWENGYHALASLDDNADGLLTGEELRGIRLWHDQNTDGRSTPNEIIELHQLGITALDTRYTTQHQIPTSPTGARFTDNSTRPTYDIILHQTR
jgi:hypothetical protein